MKSLKKNISVCEQFLMKASWNTSKFYFSVMHTPNDICDELWWNDKANNIVREFWVICQYSSFLSLFWATEVIVFAGETLADTRRRRVKRDKDSMHSLIMNSQFSSLFSFERKSLMLERIWTVKWTSISQIVIRRIMKMRSFVVSQSSLDFAQGSLSCFGIFQGFDVRPERCLRYSTRVC